VEIIKNLVVGQPGVDITYFNKFFVAHKINEYSLELLNLWNNDLRNVFVDVDVKKDQQKIDQFRTRSVDMQGLASEQIKDYFDAKEKSPGEYSFEMVVNFWNSYKMESKTFEAELITEDEYTKLHSPTGAATLSLGGISLTAIILIFSLIIIVMAFLITRHYFKNRLKEDKGKISI